MSKIYHYRIRFHSCGHLTVVPCFLSCYCIRIFFSILELSQFNYSEVFCDSHNRILFKEGCLI